MINIIAAVGKNLELGKNNDLIWHLKGDMRYFRDTTTNHIVVMGKNTYLSIGKPLPNRVNIVITHSNIDSVKCVSNPSDILDLSKSDDIFIIGGASIYEYFLPYADNLYLTEIDDDKDADTYFPTFDKEKYNKEILDNCEEDGIKYTFVIYRKK